MPTMQAYDPEQAGEQYILVNLADPSLQLNLSADPWNLDPRAEAPVILGRDVLVRGSLRPEGGRKPIGVSIGSSDRPLTAAMPSTLNATTPVRYRDIYDSGYTGTTTTLKNGGHPVGGSYAWPAEMVGAYIIRNDDERAGAAQIAIITGRTTITNTNDTLTFLPAMSSGWTAADKFTIIYPGTYDRRGIWLTNGRKFWLLRGGSATLYLDLGSDTYLGMVWSGAQISRSRFMFVAPASLPRIIDIRDTSSDTSDSTLRLPGMFPPGNPAPDSSLTTPNRGVYGEFQGRPTSSSSSAVLSPTEQCGIRVRGVNLDTGAESDFVQVVNIDAGQLTLVFTGGAVSLKDPGRFQIGFRFTDGIVTGGSPQALTSVTLKLLAYIYSAGDILVIESPTANRGAYVISGGSSSTVDDYASVPASSYNRIGDSDGVSITGANLTAATGIVGYIITRADGLVRGLISVFNDPENLLMPYDPRWTHVEIWRTTAGGSDYYLERRIEMFGGIDPHISVGSPTFPQRSTIQRIPALRWACEMSDSELVGQTPLLPMDKLSGQLPPVCRKVAANKGITVCGGAASTPYAASSAYAYGFRFDAGGTYVDGSPDGTVTKTGWFTFYSYEVGDQLEIVSPSNVAGVYSITSRVSADAITIPSLGGAATITSAHIRRFKTIPWPRIISDEEVAYSRTDKSAPESFVKTRVQLSSIGDTLMGLVGVGNYFAAIMRSGVHLLIPTAIGLDRDTVATAGEGTPWENSVAVYRDTVVWAHPEGPRRLVVFPTPNGDGRYGELSTMDPEGRFRSWFQEALANGDDIDTGIDTSNKTIRFRRRNVSTHFYQVLQFSYSTGLWTLLDDDCGTWYARTRHAESGTATDELLYSITTEGAAFEVNCRTTSHPYDSKTVQAVLTGAYTVTTTSITKTGAFSTSMLGDIVRFRSTDSGRNGVVRKITAATADSITFAAVTGLTAGDEFIIGAVRFKIRSAPLRGAGANVAARNIYKCVVRALPGPRAGVNWPNPPTGKISVKCYENYKETADDVRDQEIPVFHDENNVAYTDEDRVSSVEGQGSSLQLEIECIDSRTDFKLESVNVVVHEEGNEVTDASTES